MKSSPDRVIGMKSGRLTVIGYVGVRNRNRMYECRCECGNVTVLKYTRISSGKAKSCGCGVVDALIKRNTKHGKAKRGKKPTSYSRWTAMKARCYNPANIAYSYYGGKGVKICDRWLDFENFYADMGEPPPHHTIDRIDSSGDYCPENCRWSTMKTQNNNKSNNRLLTLNGRTQTAAQWADEVGIKTANLLHRLSRGWTVERAITTPQRKSPSKQK